MVNIKIKIDDKIIRNNLSIFFLNLFSNIEEVLTIEDIKSLKLEVKKHRHNLDTKPYIGNFFLLVFTIKKHGFL